MVSEDNKYIYLDFETNSTYLSRDPYFGNNRAYFGGLEGIYESYPTLLSTECVAMNSGNPLKTSPVCATLPPCNQSGLPANELICNGSFEQYCSALNGLNQPAWATPEHVFQQGSGNFAGSDVVNWNPNNETETPDFFVRGGIGHDINFTGSNGFHPFWNQNGTNWILFPPTETWNGQGNGVAGLCGEGIIYQEGITTTLRQAVSPNTTYTFSGWFYSALIVGGTSTSPFTHIASIDIVLLDQTGNSTYLASSLYVPFTGNNNQNNGWYYGVTTFTTPSNIGNKTKLSIINNSYLSAYVLMDDVSLKIMDPTVFPQYINTGSNNDLWHRVIKTDASDNVYIATLYANLGIAMQLGLAPNILASQANPTLKGTLVAKYSPTGNLIWNNWHENVLVQDFEITNAGNLFLVGETDAAPIGAPWPNINYLGTVTQPISCIGTSYTLTAANTPNMLMMQLNGANGQVIGTIDAYGDLGAERAMGVEIVNNKAYITTEISDYTHTATFGGTNCNFNLTARLIWNGVQFNTHQILIYNISTQTFVTPNFTIPTTDLFERSAAHGNNLLVLTPNNLYKIDLANSNTITNMPLPMIASYNYQHTAKSLDVMPNGDIYLIFLDYVTGQNAITRCNINSMSTQTGIAYYPNQVKKPLKVVGKGSNVYVAFLKYQPNTPVADNQLEIVKLDLNPSATFGDIAWSNTSGGGGINFHDFGGGGDFNSFDMAAMNTSNHIISIANYASTNANWTLQLPPTYVVGTNGALFSHTVIARIEDFGGYGQFNKQDTVDSELASGIKIYPNPASDFVVVEYDKEISKIGVVDLNGKIVLQFDNLQTSTTELNLANLPSGFYILKIYSGENCFTKKLVIY